MTSKISFSKMVRDEMHKLSWMTAVQLLVFGMLIPFRVLMVMASVSTNLKYGVVYTQQEKMNIFCRNVGLNRFENTVFIVAAGILCAYCAFSYLHSPAKLDFYHSLPIKREKLFAVKLTASSLTFVTAYLISQALALLAGTVFSVVNGEVVLEVLVSSLMGILFFLYSYSGALLAVMLTGKLLTSVLATGTLGLYLPLLHLIGMMFLNLFMKTALTSEYYIGRSESLRYTSPWALCLLYRGGGRVGLTGMWPGIGSLCVIAAVTVIFLLISLQLYRIRKTEAAGSAIAFDNLENIIKLLLTVPTAVVAAMVAYELYDSPVWELAFILLFGALGCMIMEFIYRWDIRQVLMHKKHIIMTVVLAAAIFFSVRFDVAGYNTYLPQKSEVSAMAVKSWQEDFAYNGAGEENDSDAGFSAELLDYLETEEFGPIYRLAQQGVENEKTGSFDANTTRIAVKYHLKNGKEIYRCYWVDVNLYYDVMNEMMKEPDYMERFYPIMTWTEEYISGLNSYFYLSDNVFPDLVGDDVYYQVEIPSGRMQELVDAYRQDLQEQNFKTVWEYTNMLNIEENHSVSNYPLSGKMTNTMKLLRDIAKSEIEAGNVGNLEG